MQTFAAVNSILAEGISKAGKRQRSNFPVISHEDSEGGWNVGLPSLLWHSVLRGRQGCQLYSITALYTQDNSSVLISVRRWVNPRATECGQKEKIPRTLLGIEPGTSHLVPQCLNQLQDAHSRSVQFSHHEYLVSHHCDLTHLSRCVAVKSFCAVYRSVAIFVS